MQAKAYEGYFENGHFYAEGRSITIPERQRVYLTVLDESITETEDENAKAWAKFLLDIKKIDNEPLSEFEQVKFQEIEILSQLTNGYHSCMI